MDKNKAMKLALDALLIWEEMHPKTTASAVRSPAIQALQEALEQPECNQHPDAPHGFNRESSHSLGRYVCDCEGWEPEEQEPVAWWNPRYGKGEYAFAEEQSPPDDQNDQSDFGWNIPLYAAPLKQQEQEQEPIAKVDMTKKGYVAWMLNGRELRQNQFLYTAPPKPAQDLIVGYADSHDIARDGHDFWVSRQPGKNTVPLYLYGHPPKIWQGLTDEDIAEGAKQSWVDKQAFESAVWWSEAKLKEKNT